MFNFRLKTGLTVTFIIILLSLAAYVLVVLPLAKQAEQRAEATVKRASQLVQNSQRLHAFKLVALVKDASSRPEFISGVQKEEEKDRRASVFDAISQYDNRLRDRRQKADFFAVVDKEGKVIARDLDMHDMYGEKLSYEGIQDALLGKAASAVWLMKNRMMRAAASPILSGGEVKGAVVIAYDFTSAEARDEHKDVSAHVAYFLGNVVRASSFTKQGDENVEDSGMLTALNKTLMGEKGKCQEAISGKKVSDVFELKVQNETYLTITGPLPEPVTLPVLLRTDTEAASVSVNKEINASQAVGFVVLASVDDALASVAKVRWLVLGFTIFALLLIFAAMWTVARHFLIAQDNLELGVSEVINGNMDYTFDALQEFEGLANALNVMLARLLGRPEPGEDGEIPQGFDPAVVHIEGLDESGDDRENSESVKLRSEEEDIYYARIYSEYIEELKKLRYDVSSITKDSIVQKLKANTAMLQAKHKCDKIRFKVSVDSAGQVSFKPLRLV